LNGNKDPWDEIFPAWGSPHSLGKLIEWKPQKSFIISLRSLSPHSLGKLIEWKPKALEGGAGGRAVKSPLAGETN